MSYQVTLNNDLLEIIYKRMVQSIINSIKNHAPYFLVWDTLSQENRDSNMLVICSLIKQYFTLENNRVLNPGIIQMMINDVFSIMRQYFKQNVFYEFSDDFSLVLQGCLEETGQYIYNNLLVKKGEQVVN